MDFLKIDGSFVRDITDDAMDRALVDSINQIGHVLGIATIAEYVENEQTLALLRTMGVDYAQGCGIANPRPIEELVATLASGRDALERRPIPHEDKVPGATAGRLETHGSPM